MMPGKILFKINILICFDKSSAKQKFKWNGMVRLQAKQQWNVNILYTESIGSIIGVVCVPIQKFVVHILNLSDRAEQYFQQTKNPTNYPFVTMQQLENRVRGLRILVCLYEDSPGVCSWKTQSEISSSNK